MKDIILTSLLLLVGGVLIELYVPGFTFNNLMAFAGVVIALVILDILIKVVRALLGGTGE